jgi:hypothetical protein
MNYSYSVSFSRSPSFTEEKRMFFLLLLDPLMNEKLNKNASLDGQ